MKIVWRCFPLVFAGACRFGGPSGNPSAYVDIPSDGATSDATSAEIESGQEEMDASSREASTGESSTDEASTGEASTGEASTGEASTDEASTDGPIDGGDANVVGDASCTHPSSVPGCP
jgi:hypothetical protein